MIIIQCNRLSTQRDMTRLWHELCEQARRGLILLPDFCRLAAVIGKDEEIVINYCPPEEWRGEMIPMRVVAKKEEERDAKDPAGESL